MNKNSVYLPRCVCPEMPKITNSGFCPSFLTTLPIDTSNVPEFTPKVTAY